MQNIIVSGGTKGIGRAIIEKYASQGNNIFTCARNLNELNSLKSQIEGDYSVKCHVFQADLSQKEETFAFANFVKQHTSKFVISHIEISASSSI